MDTPLVNNYLDDLNKNLKDVKKEDRESYTQEVHDHINSLVEEKIEEGFSRESAESLALQQFPEAKTLANNYLIREELLNDPVEKMDFDFRFKGGLIAIGIAQLIGLLFQNTINYYVGIIGIIMIIVGNTLVFTHKNWKEDNVKYMFWLRITIAVSIPVTVFIFFLRDTIDYASITYVSSLSLFTLMQLLALQGLIKRINKK